MNVREQLLDAGSSGAVVPPREGARNGWDGWATVPEGIPRWTRIGIGGLRPLSTGLKPIADEIRKMPPFASPKRQGSTSKRGEATEESRVVRLIDPKAEAVPVSIDIGDGGIIRRFGFQECMDGPAPLASVRPPAALREVRMNGFPEALAEVLRHRVGAGRRHLRDTSPTGMSDPAKVGKPAYSV